jgi:hypothetical protein
MPGHQPPPAATTAFQPMRPSAILGTAFRLYRRHWRTLLPIIALAAPVAVSFPSTKVLRGPGSAYQVIVHHRVVATGGSWADTVIVALVVVVALVVAGAVTRAAVAAVSGEELGVRRGYGFGIGRLWPLLQVLLASWLLTMLGVVLLVVSDVIVGVLLVVSIPALVVEGGGARHALIRSLGLVGGQWWHTFGTVLLTWLLLGLAVNLVDTAVGGSATAGSRRPSPRRCRSPSSPRSPPWSGCCSTATCGPAGNRWTPTCSGPARGPRRPDPRRQATVWQ